MTTKCYAMVRGSAIRVTGLNERGGLPSPIRCVVSKSVSSVRINEVTESGTNELEGSEDTDNEPRLRLVRSEQTINYNIDIDFLRVDPGVLSLVAGVPLVLKGETAGFGLDEFGEFPFGDAGGPDSSSVVVGFDSDTRRPPACFALEVWSKLSGADCAAGVRQYGYTVFPFLRGGYLSGFEFKDGLVTFNLRAAQARKVPRWGVGPYDLEGPHQRLLETVSRNTMFRTMLTSGLPPAEMNGIQETEDVIYGGTASLTTDDIISGGTAASTSPWIISGGLAV